MKHFLRQFATFFKGIIVVLGIVFMISSCVPKTKVPVQNNNLGTAKWGAMKFKESN